ncbi:hypothetical protein AAG612_04100 [Citromicrobium bathyomarinum]|uniref:hypothetical protein n=1 Tax=Citromicrobium bathyomarinum TaxID=72174 RepID=UPI00315A3A6C
MATSLLRKVWPEHGQDDENRGADVTLSRLGRLLLVVEAIILGTIQCAAIIGLVWFVLP